VSEAGIVFVAAIILGTLWLLAESRRDRKRREAWVGARSRPAPTIREDGLL
jgi:hypothetical protein